MKKLWKIYFYSIIKKKLFWVFILFLWFLYAIYFFACSWITSKILKSSENFEHVEIDSSDIFYVSFGNSFSDLNPEEEYDDLAVQNSLDCVKRFKRKNPGKIKLSDEEIKRDCLLRRKYNREINEKLNKTRLEKEVTKEEAWHKESRPDLYSYNIIARPFRIIASRTLKGMGIKNFFDYLNQVNVWTLYSAISIVFLSSFILNKVFFERKENGHDKLVLLFSKDATRKEIFISKLFSCFLLVSLFSFLVTTIPFSFGICLSGNISFLFSWKFLLFILYVNFLSPIFFLFFPTGMRMFIENFERSFLKTISLLVFKYWGAFATFTSFFFNLWLDKKRLSEEGISSFSKTLMSVFYKSVFWFNDIRGFLVLIVFIGAPLLYISYEKYLEEDLK